MIGVIASPSQQDVVREFFELFKTPWEFHRPGRVYDVVVATANQTPAPAARLLVVYGPAVSSVDAGAGVAIRFRLRSAIASERGRQFPVYGELATFNQAANATACVTAGPNLAGLRIETADLTLIRVGYDLFDEVRQLLAEGQPTEYASIPTLDIHIRMLRDWIVQAVPLVEVLPRPAGCDFIACLTHDIDFIGIRQHRFDHSMWGFVWRATVVSLMRCLNRRLSPRRLLQNWLAVASLPLVYAGIAKDFWEPFEWYLDIESGLPATYFLIPFKRKAGRTASGRGESRRATAYDVTDLPQWIAKLQQAGCEIGVHGIDSWNDEEQGRNEVARVAAAAGSRAVGVRMHWLLWNEASPSVLDRAGYAYDSTLGYNAAIGYRAGTGQVYRPLGVHALLELPLLIQDGALFYQQRLNLTEPEAEGRCQELIDNAMQFGGVFTVLWHDRSHAPERHWGDFYVRMLARLKSSNAWFATAAQATSWFRRRRSVRFEEDETSNGRRLRLCCDDGETQAPFCIRVYGRDGNAAANPIYIRWSGSLPEEIDLSAAIWQETSVTRSYSVPRALP